VTTDRLEMSLATHSPMRVPWPQGAVIYYILGSIHLQLPDGVVVA
jgi:hypothetical protein